MNHLVPRLVLSIGLVILLAACSGPTDEPADSNSLAQVGGANEAAADGDTGETAAQPVDADDDAAAESGQDAGAAEGGSAGADDPAGDENDGGGAGDGATDDADGTEAGVDEGAAPAATSIPGPISAITSTLTYVDSEIGYAIDYPEAWSIDSAAGSIVTMMSFDPAEGGRGGLLPQDARVDIVPDLSEVGTTSLSHLIALTSEAGRELSREEWELEGGIPAVRLHLASTASPTGEALMLLAVIDGRGVRVQGFGDVSLFDPIARSLRRAE